jgi:hypothetical protein
MVTNLDARDFPAELFGDLYHQRWRVEEAFMVDDNYLGRSTTTILAG